MNIKRTAVFFANSRLRVVRMGDGGWKRGALDGNKERFVQKKSFWFEKAGDFQVRLKSFRQKTTFWFTEKENFFSSCKATR